MPENDVALDRMLDARKELQRIDARAYLELHIEQGPVLESMQKATGVVLGTFGVERHMIRFTGQAAHSGSTPIPMRRDAFLAAAQTALECREIGLRHSRPTPGDGVVQELGRPRRRLVGHDPDDRLAVGQQPAMGLVDSEVDQPMVGAVLHDLAEQPAERRCPRQRGHPA